MPPVARYSSNERYSAALFLDKPHEQLYPCFFDEDNKLRPEAREALLQHVLKEIPIEHRSKLNFNLIGDGASYNWNDTGDLDIQIWVDGDEEDLVIIRDAIRPVNFPTAAELGLEAPGCTGAMEIQYYAKLGAGTTEDNLAQKPYACYDIDADEWVLEPVPVTPKHFGDLFLEAEPIAQEMAVKADNAIAEYERAREGEQYWQALAAQYPEFVEVAEEANIETLSALSALRAVYRELMDVRAQAYAPDGEGIDDPRDAARKLLEVWNVWPRIESYAKIPVDTTAVAASRAASLEESLLAWVSDAWAAPMEPIQEALASPPHTTNDFLFRGIADHAGHIENESVQPGTVIDKLTTEAAGGLSFSEVYEEVTHHAFGFGGTPVIFELVPGARGINVNAVIGDDHEYAQQKEWLVPGPFRVVSKEEVDTPEASGWSGDEGKTLVVTIEQVGRTAKVAAKHDGVIVALVPPDNVSDALHEAAEDDAERNDSHVTIAYLGKDGEVDRDALLTAVEAFAEDAWPVECSVGGWGVFHNDEYALYASVDIPTIESWRQTLVDYLEAAGISPAQTHGFTAHLTVKYDDEEIVELPPLPDLDSWVTDEVWVFHGGERVPFKLSAPRPKTAAKVFYHVSTAKLSPGDVVIPAGGRSPFEGMTDPQYAYACDSNYLGWWEREIKEWAEGFYEYTPVYTYQVEPVGEVVDDPVMRTPGNYASLDGWRVISGVRIAMPIVDNPTYDESTYDDIVEALRTAGDLEEGFAEEFGEDVVMLDDIQGLLPVEQIPIEELVPTQDWLNTDKFDLGPGGKSGQGAGGAIVFRHHGVNYLMDGHHRYYKRWKGEEPHPFVEAFVLDLDDPTAAWEAAKLVAMTSADELISANKVTL